MSTLEKRLTTLQIQKLRSSGINNLYDLVTYLPLGIHKVIPITNFNPLSQENTKYLDQAILENIVHRKGAKHFLQIQWKSQLTDKRYQTYFFSLANYTLQNLKVGQEFQLLLVNKNNFWNLERFSRLANTISQNENLELGKSKIQEYYEVYYPKLGFLPSNYIKSLHFRLKPEDYKLNLHGLVVNNEIIPQLIDMQQVHKPNNYKTYKETLDQWLSFQIYLKLVITKYINHQQIQKFGRATTLDLKYLKEISGSLPFSLSHSQKTAIWKILQEMSS